MRPLRVVHVMGSRSNGGAETYCCDMIGSLHGSGLDQIAIVPRASISHGRLDDAGVKLAPEVFDIRFGPWQRYKLRNVIRAFQPDLVHCWMRRAAYLVPWLDGPVIGWFGGYYDPKNFTRCTTFVGVTKDIVRHMIDRGVSADRAHYVPTFPTIKTDEAVDRSELDTPTNATVVLALSRLHEKKGLDILLRAMPRLPRCVAWIAGDGPLEADLKKLAADLDISNRVRFLGWRQDRGALLRAADICVLPSRYEPFGTVMLEAWAAGTPLIAAASQGPAATIEDGTNGLLVPIDDSIALSDAIFRVATNSDLRSNLITRGHAAYEGEYTQQVVTARMVDLYRGLMNESAARSAGRR